MSVNTIPVTLKLAAEGRSMTTARFQKAIQDYDGGPVTFTETTPGIASGQIGMNGGTVSGAIHPISVGNTVFTLLYNNQPVVMFAVTVMSGKSGTLTIAASDVTVG